VPRRRRDVTHTRVLTGRGYRRDARARYSYSSMGVRVGEGGDDNDANGESGVMVLWYHTRGWRNAGREGK